MRVVSCMVRECVLASRQFIRFVSFVRGFGLRAGLRSAIRVQAGCCSFCILSWSPIEECWD